MEFLKTYWRVLFALVVVVGFSIRALWGSPVITIADLATMVGFALAALLALHLAESFDLNLKFRSIRNDLRSDLKAVIDLAEQYSARIVEFTKQADYADLFGGLTGEFRSYNPHQFSHQAIDLDENAIISTMRTRYRDVNFARACYLLCVGDDYGRANFTRFALRLKKVARTKAGATEVKGKVRVRVSRKPFPPEVTFHLQEKLGAERTVAELRMPGLTVGSSPVPRNYLVTNVRSVRTLLSAYFEQEWASALEVDLDILLQLNEDDSPEDVQAKLDHAIRG